MTRNGIKGLRADIIVPIMTNPLIRLQESPPQLDLEVLGLIFCEEC